MFVSKHNYIIGCGWWCDGTGVHTHSQHQKGVDPNTRQKDFFDTWYKAITEFTNPRRIVVIDSNSPVKPRLSGKKNISFISLNKNYGAGLDGTRNKKLSGWDRSIIGGAAFAFLNEADYFVYIEQDCLIYGDGIIEEAIDHMKREGKPLMVGSGSGTPQPIQQSFIIIRRDYIPTFFERNTGASKELLSVDCEQRYLKLFPNDICHLPFNGGRQRPIKWDKEYFYAQHMNSEQMNKFKNKIKNS